MKKKNQPGGFTEEFSSTPSQKNTTKKSGSSNKTKISDGFITIAKRYWADNQAEVLTDTILSRGSTDVRSANPRSPENLDWWNKEGPELAANWMRFREHSPWQIWITPDGIPAIELEMHVEVNDVMVKMVLDRVMVNDQGELIIVDLKTGRRTPQSTLQLGFYRYGLWKTFDILVDKGAYWMARSAAMTDTVSLSEYTPEKIEYLIQAFDNARKAGAFIPNTSSCGMCGYTMHCEWYVPKGEKTSE